MKTLLLYLFIFFSHGFDSQQTAEKKVSGYQPGERAANFQLKNTEGKMVSLNDFQKEKGIVLIFTCNHCPFSIAYEDRIIELHEKYAGLGYPVVAINPNDAQSYPDDSYEKMVIRAKEKKFPFHYLHDETQEIAKTYGATRTPHVYILQKKGADFEVAYIGAIDDNTDNPAEVKKRYLKEALDQLLAGNKPEPNLTKAIGCSIKWKKTGN
jgi:peroxiredoxin